ncbi:MAG: universal stress protein [Chloroflexi bacterium]|nr:universal stress protein [Chloroflexota bacterium]
MNKHRNRSPEDARLASGNEERFQWLLAPFQRAANRPEGQQRDESAALDDSEAPPQQNGASLPRLRLRRILVALDTSLCSLAALEAAADLAASLKAQLDGLFIEDVALVRMAELPVVREVFYPSGIPSQVDPVRVERQLRAQASQAREALLAVCSKRKVKGSFRVVRGEVSRELVAAAGDADLLILGRVSRPFTRSIRIGSTARAAAMQAPISVLLMHKDLNIRAPIVVVCDGTPTGMQALSMGVHLAQRTGGYLTVLFCGDMTLSIQQALRAQAGDMLRKRRIIIRSRRLSDATTARLAGEIKAEAAGTLVLSDSIDVPQGVPALLEELDCPVMLVRLPTSQNPSEEGMS